jgi:hypothetical protein
MDGNVWEWVEDSWHANYDGAPTDGSAWLLGGDPSHRVVRGGSWRNESELVRAAVRLRRNASIRFDTLGFPGSENDKALIATPGEMIRRRARRAFLIRSGHAKQAQSHRTTGNA